MGIIQKDALRTSVLSYIGLVLGYLNKGVFFIWFLSTEQIGLVNLIVAVGLLFAQISNLGVINTIWKFLPFFKNAEAKNYGFMYYMLSIVFFGVVICTSLSLIFKKEILSFYTDKSEVFSQYYYWIIPIGISQVLFLVFEAYLKSLYKNVVPVFVNEILYRFFVLIALLLLGFGVIPFDSFLILYFLILIFPFIALVIYTYVIGELYIRKSQLNIKKSLKKLMITYSAFNYVNTTGALLVMSIDTLMVGSMVGLKATGVYTTIIYLSSALSIPYRSITRIATPIISEAWKERTIGKLEILYKQVSSVSLFLGMIAFSLVWINRDEIFDLLPRDYQAGIPVFLFLMMGRFFDYFGGLNGQIFLSSKKYKYDIYFTLSLIIIVIALNYLLIPIYGITGAAISTCFALAVYNIGRMLFIQFVFKINPVERSQLYILVLFLLNMLIFETILKFEYKGMMGAFLKSILFAITFMAPIYFFNLEKNSVLYINSIFSKFKRR